MWVAPERPNPIPKGGAPRAPPFGMGLGCFIIFPNYAVPGRALTRHLEEPGSGARPNSFPHDPLPWFASAPQVKQCKAKQSKAKKAKQSKEILQSKAEQSKAMQS